MNRKILYTLGVHDRKKIDIEQNSTDDESYIGYSAVFLCPKDMPTRDVLNIKYAYQKYLYANDQCEEAIYNLRYMIKQLGSDDENEMHVKFLLKLGEWQLVTNERNLTPEIILDSLNCFHKASSLDPTSYFSWHAFAIMNFTMVEYLERENMKNQDLKHYVEAAVRAFFKSISLAHISGNSNVLQDILRLLTLWFNYGMLTEIYRALQEGFVCVSIETWLQVIPQLIARLSTRNPHILDLLLGLLKKTWEKAPSSAYIPSNSK